MQVIRFTGVYKSYEKGAPALRDLSFNVRKGEFIFLTGPSAAGKSTLLKLLYMEIRPSEGEVRVSGFSSRKIHRREIPYLRRRLGIIFQDFQLLKNRTARENVAFALEVTGARREAIMPKVQRTLAAVGLGQKGDRYPRELSGGEQQRVAIARALVNDPFILLADEPTGNLDTKTSLEILRILREINSLGMAVLLATHDYTLLNEYPEARVLHLENGMLVSDTANLAVRGAEGATAGILASQVVGRGGEAPARVPQSQIDGADAVAAAAATRLHSRPLPALVGEPRLRPFTQGAPERAPASDAAAAPTVAPPRG